MTQLKAFGHNLRKFRTLLGLTQSELGKQLGIATTQVSFYERGSSLPNIELIQKITRLFNLPITEFINFPARDEFYTIPALTQEKYSITINHIPCTAAAGLINIPESAIEEEAELNSVLETPTDRDFEFTPIYDSTIANFLLIEPLYSTPESNAALTETFCPPTNATNNTSNDYPNLSLQLEKNILDNLSLNKLLCNFIHESEIHYRELVNELADDNIWDSRSIETIISNKQLSKYPALNQLLNNLPFPNISSYSYEIAFKLYQTFNKGAWINDLTINPADGRNILMIRIDGKLYRGYFDRYGNFFTVYNSTLANLVSNWFSYSLDDRVQLTKEIYTNELLDKYKRDNHLQDLLTQHQPDVDDFKKEYLKKRKSKL